MNEIEKENILEQNKFRIYKDDSLAIVENMSCPIIGRLSKRFINLFNRFDLDITIDSNLVKIDFLDVELDLRNYPYVIYRKPNFQATYVNVESNHPQYVVNQVPKSINERCLQLNNHI